jgi:hypothetical protein
MTLSIKKKLQNIIGFLISGTDGSASLSGISIGDQFRPGETDDISVARNLNASFLMALAGHALPGSRSAHRYLKKMKSSWWGMTASFLSRGVDQIYREMDERYAQDGQFRGFFNDLHDSISSFDSSLDSSDIINKVWRVFFPEGVVGNDVSGKIASLREKRKVRISSLNDDPVRAPEREVLFTANALVTMPYSAGSLERLAPDMRDAVRACAGEEQLYWYDHPVQIGAAPEENELLYGLHNLSEALRYEESSGGKDPARNADCVLSVSVTHRGLRGIARDWLQSELVGSGTMRGINLYAVTEDDADLLLEDVILPAARRFIGDCDVSLLKTVFGVDGDYGRHYSFLKAIALFWRVCVSPEIKGTFKIDLDQVFPQEELAGKTGASAFGHLRTPLWGARGTDSNGDAVYLGMIAGALVNRNEIDSSLFAPDVVFPDRLPQGDETVFWSRVPQALSTAAEMTARYGEGREYDGTTSCMQRVHVTGGSAGVLVEALKRYRPFTPTCIGRAEDQAYLLSVLYRTDEWGYLRYAHEPGLIMRHDDDLFAGAAEAARSGKTVGDYIRIMLFSDYARALPWTVERVKDALDPFTGCFISGIPITIVYLRFALKTAHLFASGNPAAALRFVDEGIKRFSGIMEPHERVKNPLSEIYKAEKRGWDIYYDVMEIMERKISSGDPFAKELADKAKSLVNSFRI